MTSLVEDIYNNQNYFWSNDKLVCLNEEDVESRAIPEDIKVQIVCNYLFKELFDTFSFFLQPEISLDQNFLFALSRGLMPRRFDANDQADRIIYEENQEVAEMYFVMQGFIGYAVNQLSDKINQGFYKIGKKQYGKQIIADHYVVNKVRSRYIYIALKESHCYCLTRKFMHRVLFPEFKEQSICL